MRCFECGLFYKRGARGLCQPCYQRAYHAAHRDEAIANNAAYYVAHHEVMNARDHAYRAVHLKEEKARNRAYRAAHLEEKNAYNAAYSAAHREEQKARDHAYRVAHPEVMREKSHRRRACKRAAYVSPVSMDYLYKRDRGICGICGRKVERKVASLDHILPLACGGKHESANARLTHLRCNISRQHRGAAQLRLFG